MALVSNKPVALPGGIISVGQGVVESATVKNKNKNNTSTYNFFFHFFFSSHL